MTVVVAVAAIKRLLSNVLSGRADKTIHMRKWIDIYKYYYFLTFAKGQSEFLRSLQVGFNSHEFPNHIFGFHDCTKNGGFHDL